MAVNSVSIVGNLTEEPELRYTKGEAAVTNFSIAANKRVKNGDDWEDELVGFFRVTAWRSLAENICESLDKGDRIMVNGRLKQNSWENDEGEKRYAIEIVAEEVGPSLRWKVAIPESPEDE